MKLQEQNSNGTYSVTLPKQIVTAYGWKKGDHISYRIEKQGTITLYKKE